MLLEQLALTSAAVASVGARTEKITRLADLLREADDPAIVVAWLSGELPQRQIGVGYAALRELPGAATEASLTVEFVHETFDQIKQSAGPGSQARRRELLMSILAAATPVEQNFLRGLLSGDLRQGALAGVMTAAIAKAAGVALDDVRRAAMLRGDLAVVAAAALRGGAPSLAEFTLQVGRPISPMLAQTASDPANALQTLGGEAAFEWKLDGARVQIHRDGPSVSIFTRSLDDITERLPEIVEAVLDLPVGRVILDGEAIALRPDGRPLPFQVTAARIGSKQGATPLTAMIFDILHLDGRDLLDEPARARRDVLERIVPEGLRTPRLVTGDAEAAAVFLDASLGSGHEGVVAKSLTAPYEAGRRGAGWLKIKPVHTLDLVVLAVERGSGRRQGTLSNIHLGARSPDGGFIMLGKTFKGMTDAMLTWQTKRFSELATTSLEEWVVQLRPEQVVEIAFDGVQRSTRYPGGVALRFARVLRYRDDKTSSEADTIDAVRAYLPR